MVSPCECPFAGTAMPQESATACRQSTSIKYRKPRDSRGWGAVGAAGLSRPCSLSAVGLCPWSPRRPPQLVEGDSRELSLGQVG